MTDFFLKRNRKNPETTTITYDQHIHWLNSSNWNTVQAYTQQYTVYTHAHPVCVFPLSNLDFVVVYTFKQSVFTVVLAFVWVFLSVCVFFKVAWWFLLLFTRPTLTHVHTFVVLCVISFLLYMKMKCIVSYRILWTCLCV